MKKAKWIIGIFIISLCFMLGSELFQNYTSSFSNQFFYFDISMVDDRNNLYELLTEYAEDSEMGVFSLDYTTYNARYTEITIYATDMAQTLLEKEYYISSGEKRSLFSGTTEIHFNEFSEIVDNDSIIRYYFTGNKDQVSTLRDKVYATYATSYIHRENTTGTEWLIGAIWAVSLLFLLLLTWLDIQFQKKENFLQISLGSSPWKIIGTNILTDIVAFAGVFVFTYLILGRFAFLDYGLDVAFVAICVFVFINSLLYLILLKYDYKQILYGANINERTLSNSYVLKAITMIVAIASLSVNVSLIAENARYLGYYQDIYQYGEYDLLYITPTENVVGDDANNTFSEIKTEIFLRYYIQGKVAFSLSNGYDNKDNPIITVTDTANGFVGNQSLLSDLGNYDYHVFVPNERVNDISAQDIEFALWSTICLFGQELNDALYEVIYYDNTEVLYFDFGETSKLSVGFDKIRNPIFVYVTLSQETLESVVQNTTDLALGSTFNNLTFNLTEEEITQLSNIDGIKTVAHSSLVDQCDQYKSSLLRVVLLNSIISAFLLLLETIIIVTIVKLEYMVNAKSLAIRKILGYTMFSNHREVFLLNLAGSITSIVTMIIVSLMFGVTRVFDVLLVGISLSALEAVLIAFNIFKLERTSIPKILKGGNL